MYSRCISLIFFIVFFISLHVRGQVVYFDILKGGDKLGSIKAEKKITNSTTIYTSISKATFRVVWEYIRETDITTIYQNGLFISLDSKQLMDGKLKEHYITQKKDLGYLCTRPTSNETFTLKQNIIFSSNMLYFTEPKGQKFIYAEGYQSLCALEEISNGIYKLSLPEGKINHYVYKNGVLEEIRVFRTIVDLVFKRVK